MSQTFTYQFTDPNGQTDSLTITASTTLSTITSGVRGDTVTGKGYAVTSITGSIAGTAIKAEVGTAGSVQTDTVGNNAANYDNAVFPVTSSGGNFGGGTGSSYGLDVNGLEFTVGTTHYNLYEQNGTFTLYNVTNNTSQTLTLVSTNAPCYAAGTRILTSRGELPVEALQVGDKVVTMRSGIATEQPIRWIGHRAIALDHHSNRSLVEPVRIHAGAMGHQLPRRDLLVSPDHALYVDGVLIEAKYLVNGVSIQRETAAKHVTYYHVELDSHDILLAEGLPAESYISDGNRTMFDNALDNNGSTITALHANFSTQNSAERCAPLVHQGPLVEAVRARLRERVMAEGFTTTNTPQVALVVGGTTIHPLPGEMGTLRFALPDDAKAATLHVQTATPADTDISPQDQRQLGVKLIGAAILTGLQPQPMDLTSFDGLFAADQGEGQWSHGTVNINLAATTGTARVLELRYGAAITRWVAPLGEQRATG